MTPTSWRRGAGAAAAWKGGAFAATAWKGGAFAATCALLSLSAQAVDLTESYQRALQADPSLRAAQSALIAGREKGVQGDALLRPQVGLSASAARVNDRSSTTLPPALAPLIPSNGSGNVQEAAVQLKQPIYDLKSAAERQQAHQQSEISEVQWRHTQQELMQSVGEAYFGVLLAQEALQVKQAEKAAVQRQRDRAQARFDVGRGKITDLQEAQARLDTVSAEEVSAQSQLTLAQAQYLELTGSEPVGLAPLKSPLMPTPPMPDSLAAWQLKSRETNTRVQLKQHEMAIAGQEIRKTSLQSRPTLDLVASYTAKNASGNLSPLVAPDGTRIAAIGLQLSVPLYAGGAIDSRQRESIAKKNQADEALGAARRDARLQVQDAFLAVKTGVARIAALEQSLASATTALEATTLGRDVGTRTELDVLDAQQRVYGAQLNAAQARHDYLLGRLRLAAAAGELQESDLRALDAYLTR